MSKVFSLGTESRKVAVFLPLFASMALLCYFGKITGAELAGFAEFGFTALAAGLTAEHFATPKS